MYKESKYTFKETLDGYGMLLYNSRTGAIVSIEEKNIDRINTILSEPDLNIDDEFFNALKNNGFILDNDFDELSSIKSKYDNVFYNTNNIKIVMLPAEICNFACPYCFVYSYKDKTMENKVYENAIKYIDKKIALADKSKKIVLNLSWFGGEPLLQRDKIISFMDEINSRYRKDNLEIISGIVTNGYYLDYSVFKKLLDRGIKQFQVTFDGAKEDHNITRALKDGTPTFDHIINQIKDILANISPEDKFNLAIRINFMRDTYKKVYGLIDYLSELFKDDNRFYIYCRPVYDFNTSRDNHTVLDRILTLDEGLEIQKDFIQYIKMRRKNTNLQEIRMINDYLPMPTDRWCASDQINNIIIGSDGTIYFCDSLIGDEEVAIGILNDSGEVIYNENSKEWLKNVFELENFKGCKECKSLPICVGSCKRQRVSDRMEKPCLFTEESISKMMLKYIKDIMQVPITTA